MRPSPHPSRSEAPHEDEGIAQPKRRMRRPAPPSIEEERKIKPFAKKPIMASNKWIMKKHVSFEDYEMYDTKIREFADAFFNYVNSTKHSKEKDTSSETKKRRHSTDQDEAEPSGERSVKPKVIVEYHKSENLDEFIQELKGIYLEADLNKKNTEEELAETKANLSRFMNKFNKDPRRAHPNLTECERAYCHMSIPMSISEKKNSTSLIEENVPPLTSTSKLNQDPDIRLSFRLD